MTFGISRKIIGTSRKMSYIENMNYLINISALQGYSSCAQDCGVDSAPLLNACGIDAKMLAKLEGYINYEQFAKLLELTATHARTPHFGLMLARKRNRAHTGMVGLLSEKCPDLRSALKNFIKYSHIHSQGFALELIEQGDISIITYKVLANVPSTKQIVELAFGSVPEFLISLTGIKFTPKTYYVTHAEDGDKQFQRFLGAPVIFNLELNAVVFDRRMLDIPLRGYNETMQELLQRNLDLLSLDLNKDITATVRNLIINLLPLGHCKLDTVAKQLLMSPRKLNYLMAHNNTTFKALVEQTRKNIAQQQLLKSDMSLTQLADILGYFDQATFTRAFKRWFGTTPKVWKKQHASP